MKLGFYLFAEYINMFVSSAIVSVLYFGGYNYPGMDWVRETLIGAVGLDWGHNLATLVGSIVFFGKIFFFIFFFMWVRWTVPRFRYDQLMNLGWKGLIPLAILNVVLTGAGLLAETRLMSWALVGIIVLVAVIQAAAANKKHAAAGRLSKV
jgi:NADH-quinone oxidoreductase subunit H